MYKRQVGCVWGLEQFKQIPDESIDVTITSPPYYNLRSYDQEGQIGLEKTIPEYMDRLMAVMVEIERVTKPTGTIWVNIGDTYAGSPSGGGMTPSTRGRASGSSRVQSQRCSPNRCA